jgi:hypothetical protein
MSGFSFGGMRDERIVADDDSPETNFPVFDEALEDVGIVFGEIGGGIRGWPLEDDEGGVGGIG